MDRPPSPSRAVGLRSALLSFAAVVGSTFFVLALRRPAQLTHPYMWVEDGTVNLPAWIHDGWKSVFQPLNGYFVLPTKVIFAVATKLSFLHQPEIAYGLTVAFSAAVLASIALSPTTLRWPAACATAVLLVPSDAEVFAVPEYAFWWGALLTLPPLFWREDEARPSVGARVAMVLLGGLSSPLIVGLAPLYAARTWRIRSRPNLVVLAAAAAAAAAQLWCVLKTRVNLQQPNDAGIPALVSQAIAKFLGGFVYCDGGLVVGAAAGTLLLTFLVYRAWSARDQLGFDYLLLLGCIAVAIALPLLRNPVGILDPVNGGPRYFFYPFILVAWALVQVAAAGGLGVRIAVGMVLALALRQTVVRGRRVHDPIDWQAQVRACSRSEAYVLPIHYDGNADLAWKVRLSGVDCSRLMAESLLDP